MNTFTGLETEYNWKKSFFSLTELMVVLLIIGLVVGLVGPAIFGKFTQAQGQAAKTQLMLFKECAKSYYLDMNEYPRSLEDLSRSSGSGSNWKGPYIEDGFIPKDPWGNEYHYESPGRDGRAFDIYSYGKDNAPGGEGNDADITSWRE